MMNGEDDDGGWLRLAIACVLVKKKKKDGSEKIF
jgi:hypothetical protein